MDVITKEEKKLNWTPVLISAAVPVLAIIIYFIFGTHKKIADWIVTHISQPIHTILGKICSIFPLCVMELFYAVVIIGTITCITCTIISVIKKHIGAKAVLYRISWFLTVVIFLFCGYLWLWGVTYNSSSFSEKSGAVNVPPQKNDFISVTEYFLAEANSLAPEMERNSEGHFSGNIDSYFYLSSGIYDELENTFHCLKATSRTPKKMFFSRLMSRMGFTGVYFVYTGESCINIDQPACLIPVTIAHELAHQRAVFSEQEANFIGIAACLSSGNKDYEYSGYLCGVIHLMNALYEADKSAWSELYGKYIVGDLKTDWDDNNEYWSRFESEITEVSGNVYDTFLKVNGQSEGTASYGACVDMLVAYYKDIA